MDLVKIGFLIQTSGLEKANKEVDSLLDKTGKIGTVSKKSATEVESSQKKAKKATEETTKAVEKNTKAVEKGNKEADKAKKAVERTTQALEKQKIVGEYLAKGLDKSTATSLANFKQLKASVIDTDTMFTLLGNNSALNKANKQTRAINDSLNKMKLNLDLVGKGFSASEQAQIRQLKANGANNAELEKAIELIKKRKQAEVLANYQNEKASLSREWMSAYDKEIEARVAKEKEAAAKIQQVRDTVSDYEARSKRSFGGGILDQVEVENKEILALRKKYTDEINAIADKESAESEARRTKEMQARQKEYQQNMELLERERNKVKQANAEREKALLIEEKRSQYVEQGFGKGDAKKLATLDVAGVDPDYLERYKKSLAATTTALGSFSDASTKASASHSGLTSQIRGIAFYAVLSTAIYGAMTAMMNLTSATVRMADEYTAIQNRMKLYIKDAGELGRVNAQLAQMSIENNVGLRETATLFSRLLPAMQKIGANTAAVTSVVDAFGKSMRIGGATAMEAASATIQFSQAMASGKLAGDEFRAISETSQRFLKAIADGSGIAAEKLKEMSSAGMLTTEVISKALLKEYPKLIEENKKLGITLEQGANAIKTGFLVAIGEFNEGAKATQYFGEMMIDLAQNMFKAAQGAREFGQDVKQWFTDNAGTINLVVEAFKILATVIVARYVVAIGLAVRESIKYQEALVSMAAQQANVTRSSIVMSSAITSVGAAMKGALAFFGGWVGLALTVASATAAYLSFNNASAATAESFRQDGEALTTTIAKYKELAKVKQQAILDKEIANLEELNKQYEENKAKLVTNVLNLSRHNDMTKAQAKSMSDLALSYKNGNISLEQLVSTVSESGYVSNESKVKTRGFAEAVVDAGEKAGLSKDLINAMRKALSDSGEAAKISKTGVDTFTKGLEDQAKKLRETTALARQYGLEIASAAKLQEQLSSQFGAKETRYAENIKTLSNLKEKYSKKGFVKAEEIVTKQLLANQQAQNALLKEKAQVTDQYVKGLKDVELAQKEQSDYTESIRKAEKDSGKSENKKEKDRNKYQEQAKELSAYITLLEEAQDVDVARIASEKEYQNAFGTSLDQAIALYELRRQSEQVEARAVFVKNLTEEEEAQGRLVALMKAGLDIATARTLVEAKFTDNAKGKEAAEQYLTNMAYEQHYALADQIDSQGVMNNLLKQGYTIEQASFRLMTARIRTLNGDSTYLDDLDKVYDTQVKQLKARQAESFVLQETDKLEKQKVAYINAQAAGYEKLALNMAIANKITQNPDLSTDQAKRLVEAEELTNYEKELADLKAKTYIATLKESDAVKDIISNYASLGRVKVGNLDRQRKILDIAKELSDEVEKQRKNPLGDFSSVDFSVFGDFGNPFEAALAGLNEFVTKSTESRNILASIEKDIVAAKEQGLSVTDLEFERNTVLANQERDRKKSIDKGITSALSLTKSLFKEESKGYKVVSGLEKAYQASKIAFALWQKKDTIAMLALSLKAHITDMLGFTTGAAAKVAAQQGVNVAKGIEATLNQGSGDPYTAFARMAAMAAAVAALGVAIGSFSGSSGGGYVDTSNQGTGTVFGDSQAKSASIANSIDLLSENSDLMLPLTSAMLRSLRNIESNIGGLTNLLIRTGVGKDFNIAEGFSPNTIGKLFGGSFGKLAGGVGGAIGGFLGAGFGDILGLATGGLGFLLGGALTSLLGGLFGSKTTIKGQGLFGEDQKLGNILSEGFNLQEYVDIQTKKKALGITTSTKNSTKYSKADAELSNQFTLIFGGFYDSILSATDILGADMSAVKTNLENAVISIGKINLKGLSGEEIQEKLEAVFGAAADDLAKQAFGGLEDFQSVGEGYYETLIKVATGVEQAAYFTDRLNVTAIDYTQILNKQGDVAAEIVRQSVLLNDSTKDIKGGFYDLVNSFDGTAEEITDFVLTLRDLQDQLFMTGKNANYLTSSMILGAGSLDRLQDGLDSYFEMLSPSEQAAELARRLTREFAEFGEELPSDVKAFRALVSSIDITTEAGQKLYGEIIALAPEFTDLQDALEKANSEVNQLVKSLRDLAEQARQARGETEQPRNLDYARAMFESTAMLAMQGDTEAAGKLMSLGTNLMNLSKQYSVDGSEYARDLAWIQRAATVSADVQEAGLGYTSSTLSTALSGGNIVTPTVSTTSTSTDAKLDALREDLNAALLAIAKYTQSTASKLENWDDGNRMMVGVIQEAGDPKVPVTTA